MSGKKETSNDTILSFSRTLIYSMQIQRIERNNWSKDYFISNRFNDNLIEKGGRGVSVFRRGVRFLAFLKRREREECREGMPIEIRSSTASGRETT